MKRIFTLKTIALVVFVFFTQFTKAQCTTTNFTVAKINASCFSNGEIKVSIPTGQTGCDTRFATITPVTGSSNIPVPNQTQTLTFLATGGDLVFGSLPAGKYNVAVSDGITTTNYVSNPVTITSSYTPMSLTLSSTAPTCTLTDSGYTQNGTFTTSITGGTGPFEYKLTSAFGVQTFSSSSRTQVFNNIKAGENVTIVVTDKVNGNAGCQVSVTQNYVTSSSVSAALSFGLRPYNFIRDCSDPNQYKIKFYINLSNLNSARLAILQQPGNAKITINGVDYPLTYIAIRNGFMYDPVAVNGPQLVNNMSITTSFNWECGTLSRTAKVVMPDNYYNYYARTSVATDCSLKLQFVVFGDQDNSQGGYVDRHLYFCPNNSVEIARRISTNPDIYQVLSGPDISPDPALTTNDLGIPTDPSIIIPSASNTFTVNEGGYYRITVSDQYHTVVNYYNAGNLTNPLDKVVVNPTASVLAGTSGFNFPIYNMGIKYPLTVKVERTDGQTTVSHTAVEPLSLAGTYTYNFPMFVTFNYDPQISGSIYDLPPGEYRFTLTDGCSNTKVFTATNATYANYTPTFSVTQGCNNSNTIAFNLNKNGFAFGTNWAPTADVYLIGKTASGDFGNVVRTVARTGSGSANFVNLPSGSYFVQYKGIGLGYSAAEKRFSPTTYFKEVVIPDYQNFTVSTGASICDTSNLNSGIVSAQITGGTYTYPITFSLFRTSNSAVPLVTYIENDTSKVEHSFSNLTTGNYFVRVASSCYSVDQNVSISTNVTAPRAIVSDPVICPLSPTTLGAISATNGLYDITWTDDADPNQTVIATGMPVVLSPAATIKYRATFKLKDFLACVNPPVYTSTVDVRVDTNPDVSLAVSDIDLCLAPTTKTVTISSSQLGYKYEIVKMDGSSFVPPISGTGTGGNLAIGFPSTFNFAAGTTLRVKTSNGANSKCTDYLTDLITITQSTPIKTLAVESTNVCQGFASSIKVKTSQSQIVYLIKKNGVPISSIPTQTGNGSDLTFTIPANQLTVGANTFTVQASNSTCGTVDLDQVATITVTASPVSNAGTAFIKTCITNPNGKQIGMTAVTGINYSWSPATGLDDSTIANPTANPTTTTTYTLTAADGTCTATSTVKVTVITTVPSVSAGADFTKTCSLNPTGNTIGSVIQGQSATYAWTPTTGLSSATNVTPTANPTATTTYRVTATETSSGCTASDEVNVIVDKSLPNIDAGADFTKTCDSNASGGTIGVSPISGQTYSWSPSTNLSSTTIANPTANPTATTTYTLTATKSATGCTATDTVVVTLNKKVPVANAGADFTKTCITNPSGAIIGVAAVTGVAYSWSPTTGLSDYTISNPTANPSGPTEYTLTTTNIASGCTETDKVLVTVDQSTIASDAGADFSKTCATNATGKLIGVTAAPGATYSWSPATGLSDALIANPMANPVSPTSYIVTTTKTATGCATTDSVTVTVDITAPSSLTLEGIDHPNCSTNKGIIRINPTGIASDSYSINGVDYQVSPVFTDVDPASYNLTVKTASNGCTSSAITAVVNPQPPIPTTPLVVVNGAATFCQGGYVDLEGPLAPTGDSYTYQWYTSSGPINDATERVYRAMNAATYTLIVTNSQSCPSQASAGIDVDVNNNPVATINNGVALEFLNCTNTLTLTASQGESYQWTLDGVAIAAPQGTARIFTATTPGSYTVTVTENSGCVATSQPTLLLPPPTIQTTSLETCAGNTIVLNSNVTSFTNPIYQWKRNGIAITTDGNNTNYSATQDGNYTLQVTERNNSAVTATSCGVSVKVNSSPTVTAGSDFTITCTTNASGRNIGETPETGFSYSWSPSAGLSNASIGNPIATPTSTTTYTVRKTNTATGCWSEDTIVVTVNKMAPNAEAGSDFTKTCVNFTSGKEIGVAEISGVTYSWSPATGLSDASLANPIANPSTTTTYILTTTKTATGCTATDTVVVTVDTSVPVADAGVDFTKTCATNATGKLIGVAAVAGVTYSWSPATGLSDASIANPMANPSATTTYTLTATKTATGCSAIDTVIATVALVPNPVATAVTIENNCPLETVDLVGIQPQVVDGIVYEWWTGTQSARDTQIINTTSYNRSGNVYLWGKTISEGCYNATASEVAVVITPCCAANVGVITDNNPFYLNHYAPADITILEHTGYSSPSKVIYVLVNDLDGKIKQINDSKPEFLGVLAGNYTVHALVFGTTATPTGIEIGNKLGAIQPLCGSSATFSITVLPYGCISDDSFSQTIPNAKQYALLDSFSNQFVQVNTTGVFETIFTGIPHQIVGFNYTGSATGIVVGGTISEVMASDLEITAGTVITGCAPVGTQIDGILYNDRDKNCKEGDDTQYGLPTNTIYLKLLNSNNEVIQVVSTNADAGYYFSFYSDLFDGTYSIIVDDNDNLSDSVATYPSSWKGNSQTFTLEFGQIVEYLSNSANFVPMCMQSATNKPVLRPTSNLVGNVYNYCQGTTATPITIDALSGAQVNWYSEAVGGSPKTTPIIPNTTVVGTTTYYVSQTLNGAESERTEFIFDVHALPEQPTAIAGDDFVVAGSSQQYSVINSQSGLTYNWILPTDWTGSSTTKDITVQVGTKEATIGVTATSAHGCISALEELTVRVVIEDDIEVYNSISPNGDGDNDIFRIRNIDFYPENTLSIFNRWGIEVYRVTSYGQNDNFFKGFSDGRSTVGRDVELPEGTYFYTLTYKNTKGIERNLSGYLYIKQ